MLRRSMVLTALVLTTAVAQAQLPGLRRKLKDAGRQAATGQPAQRQPNFDNTVLELTPQLGTRLIAGLEARSRAVGPGGQTVADLRRRAAAASDEAATLNNQHSDDREQWQNANGAAENCVSEQLNTVEQQHAQQMQQRFVSMTGVNTPEKTKFMQDYTAATQEAQPAAGGGHARRSAAGAGEDQSTDGDRRARRHPQSTHYVPCTCGACVDAA